MTYSPPSIDFTELLSYVDDIPKRQHYLEILYSYEWIEQKWVEQAFVNWLNLPDRNKITLEELILRFTGEDEGEGTTTMKNFVHQPSKIKLYPGAEVQAGQGPQVPLTPEQQSKLDAMLKQAMDESDTDWDALFANMDAMTDQAKQQAPSPEVDGQNKPQL